MSQRSREVLVNILCGSMSGMRPATEQEREQYQRNTQTNFDLLVVGNTPALQDAHVSRAGHAGAFDFDRVKRYESAWHEMKGRDLQGGTSLSELYPGRAVSDPFVAKAVDVIRQHAPQYAGKLMLHGSAFPSMAIDMASDYIDRATFDDKTLSVEAAKNIQMFLTAMSVSNEQKHVRDFVASSPAQLREMRSALDREFSAFESTTIQTLVEEIDLSQTPLPG
ncbi:hypothetical protein ACM7NO_25695 [Pseudomonas aeruginosa]